MDKGAGLLISDIPVPPKADPRLKLLHELEPRYRVFISNLTDTLSRQPSPPIPTTSRPGLFWDDVFIDSSKPWRSFMESLLWHLVAVLIVWATSPGGVPQKTALQQHRSYRASHITYYPASRSAPPPERSQSRPAESPKSARHNALAVAREHRRNVANPTAPDVNLNGRTPAPNLAANGGPAPAVPLAATGRARLNLPADWTSVVAPPPDLGRARRHAPGLPQATVVAPAPDVGNVADQRPLDVPNAAVVAPPPTLQGWVHKIENLFGEGSSSGGGQVVPPPPSIQGTDGAGGSRVSSLPGAGSQVVPPPPSVQGAGQNAGARMSAAPGVGGQVVPPPPNLQPAGGAGGRFGSLSSSGGQVVPPPPSVQGAGNGTSGRISSRLGGSALGGAQVVPPPPSVQASGGAGSGRLGTLSGSGTQVVPPPPSVQGTGSGGAGGRLGTLAGSGTQVVPPPPSVQGTGSGGGGRLGSLAGSGTQIVPPPPSLQGTGSGSGGRLGSLPGSSAQAVPPPPSVQGGGTGNGGGRMGSLSGTGSQVVPPPPSTQGAGDGSGGTRMAALSGAPDIPAPSGGAPGGGSVSTGPLQQMDDLPANPPQAAQVPSGPPPEDVPLRLINPVIPPKGSTFFSNYETFLAERRLANGKFEPIKLVYKFLPYQRRLSQYFAEGAKVHTLRVIRKPDCDEPLMEMLWPDGDPDQADPQAVANAAAMNSIDRKTMVPCFVTTAEDYQRALERGR